ncbi:unnamed protein product, partial [Polarella glacialis]
ESDGAYEPLLSRGRPNGAEALWQLALPVPPLAALERASTTPGCSEGFGHRGEALLPPLAQVQKKSRRHNKSPVGLGQSVDGAAAPQHGEAQQVLTTAVEALTAQIEILGQRLSLCPPLSPP